MNHVAVFAGIAVIVAVAAGGVTAWWLMRAVRRLAAGLAVASAVRLAGRVASARRPVQGREVWLRAAAARPRASLSWWSIRNERRALRRSVGAAEHAVTAARAAGAPVGELPALCRDLHRVHRDADRQLMLAALDGRGHDDQARAEAAAVRGSAEQIRSLAARALTVASGPASSQLAGQVEAEAVALAAGWSRLRDTGTGQLVP